MCGQFEALYFLDIFVWNLLTIAIAITITAIVASRRVLVVVVDVGDRRADGNGYEDEEPREAAYRPRLRHPREDDG